MKRTECDLSKLKGKKLRRAQNSLVEQVDGKQTGLLFDEKGNLSAQKVDWKVKKREKTNG